MYIRGLLLDEIGERESKRSLGAGESMRDGEQENGEPQTANVVVERSDNAVKLRLLRLPKRESEGESPVFAEKREAGEDVEKVDDNTAERKKSKRFGGSSHGLRSPLRPLRFEHDVESSHLMLLGRKNGKIPLRSRWYEFEPSVCKSKRVDDQNPLKPHPNSFLSENSSMVVARAVSVQTSTACESKEVQVSTDMKQKQSISDESTVTDLIEVPVSFPSNDAHKREDKAVGVQCHLLAGFSDQVATRKPRGASIGDRFPVWIDLNTMTYCHSSSEPQRYLQVASFTESPVDYSKESTLVPRVLITREDEASDHGEMELKSCGADGDVADLAPTQEPDKTQPENQKDVMALRELYRAHYSAKGNASLVSAEDGVHALKEAKNKMESIKQRLLELEACADAMDYDFKLSFLNLGGVEDEDGCRRLKAQQVASHVDRLVKEVPDIRATDSSASVLLVGILSQKATNEMESARDLLAQIEKLAAAEVD